MNLQPFTAMLMFAYVLLMFLPGREVQLFLMISLYALVALVVMHRATRPLMRLAAAAATDPVAATERKIMSRCASSMMASIQSY